MSPNIEFMPWYEAGTNLMRCAGDGGCGALLVSGDTELHLKWHERMFPYDVPLPHDVPLPRPRETRVLGVPQPSGPVCTDPGCTIPSKPGYPEHGPHDIRAGG